MNDLKEQNDFDREFAELVTHFDRYERGSEPGLTFPFSPEVSAAMETEVE